jgi:hypothetical protein
MNADEPTPSAISRSTNESGDSTSRREIGIAPLGALGAVALTGCTNEDSEPTATAIQALSGADIKWVDTVLGTSPPSGRTGDLATTTGPALGATFALAKGCVTPGDGGGGLFYWDSTSTAADDGGTIIQPAPPAGRWRRVYSGSLNVKWFGAQGDTMNADDFAINKAISTAIGQGGGEVFLPRGIYRTTQAIIIAGSNLRLTGSGEASVILPTVGAMFNTLAIDGTSVHTQGVAIQNIVFREENKPAASGTDTIIAFHVFRLTISDCLIDQPCNGIHLYACNTVEFERIRIDKVRGTASGYGANYGFLIGGDGSGDGPGSTDVVSFKNVVLQGPITGPFSTSRHGVIVDGRVATLSVYKLYSNWAEGVGLWFRNTTTSPHDPQFATIYGYESEFCQLEAIRIDVGSQMFFSDAQLFGSHQRANLTLGAGAFAVTFQGGHSRGAARQGVLVSGGRQISVNGMHIYSNSQQAPGAIGGVEITAPSRRISVMGNVLNHLEDTTQGPDVLVEAGADLFAVVGNIGSVTNLAGKSSTRVVASNAG